MKSRTFAAASRIWLLVALLAVAGIAHAAERILYEKRSSYSLITVTEDDRGLRSLWFDKTAPQSIVKPGDPDHMEVGYVRAALLGVALAQSPRRFLVVGLGGGSMPAFLRKHYPAAAIDVVDIDPDVVHVAAQFFGFREDSRMRVHVRDGREFVEASRHVYDAIFLDAYGATDAPRHLTTVEFMRSVRRVVSPRGIVIANVARFRPEQFRSTVRTYQEAFEELYILHVHRAANSVLLALPRRQPLRHDEFVRLARNMVASKNLPFELRDIVVHQFTHADRKDPDAGILRDAGLNAP